MYVTEVMMPLKSAKSWLDMRMESVSVLFNGDF